MFKVLGNATSCLAVTVLTAPLTACSADAFKEFRLFLELQAWASV